MQLLSINVGQPQDITWQGKTTRTSIFKHSVKGIKKVSLFNVEGDAQAALEFHGGRDKALYSYDSSYYDLWKTKLDLDIWPSGMFGENLTTLGLPDHEIKIGNIYQAGSVIFQAIQPRIPCTRLNIRFRRKDIYQLFYQMKCYGTYFRVLEEGSFEATSPIKLVEESPYSITIQDFVNIWATKGKDQELLKQVVDLPIVPEQLLSSFKKFLR